MAPTSLIHLFRERVRLGAHRPALRERRRGRWQSTTWGEWEARARAVASWLIERGIAPGDRVALLLSTRQAWFELDMGVLAAGAITVPLYPTLATHQHAAQIADSGARWLLTEDPLTAARLPAAALSGLRGVVVVERRGLTERPGDDGRRSLDLDELREQTGLIVDAYDDILEAKKTLSEAESRLLDGRIGGLTPSSIASVVYTSGTDGEPKGVVLTHDNFLFEIEALQRAFSLGPDDEQLLFLPMAHVFARILEMSQLKAGYVTTFSQSASRSLEEMPEIEPTFVGAVPRLFEQFHAHMARTLEQPSLSRVAIARAIDVGIEVARLRRERAPVPLSLSLQHRAAERLVLEKIRGAFGKRLRFAFCGGAPLSPSLAEWFQGVGVPLVEGYGLTECTSASHVNTPERPIPGAVGRPLHGVEARLSDDREVLLRGRNVCAGYWNRPELTSLVLRDGWLHTGDEGALDGDLLRIVGRKKELLVTSAGHKVAPQIVEALLQQSPWIQKAVVVGEGRPFVSALVSLREDTTYAWARANDQPEEMAYLAHTSQLRSVLQGEIDSVNKKLASFEKIKAFTILQGPLSAEKGELTPTGKVRREQVASIHQQEINELYGALRRSAGARQTAGGEPAGRRERRAARRQSG